MRRPVRPKSVDAIVERIAAKHGITRATLEERKTRKLARLARFECWTVLRAELVINGKPPSYPQIGAWFGRDNATIHNGVKRYPALAAQAEAA